MQIAACIECSFPYFSNISWYCNFSRRKFSLMVKEYVLSLIAVSISGLLIDVLLPEGNIRKYSNFAISIILSIILIQPITNFFSEDYNFEFKNYIQQSYQDNREKSIAISYINIISFYYSHILIV